MTCRRSPARVTAATLRFFNPEVSEFQHGYVSPDPTETLNIYDVSTSAGDMTGNSAGVAGFADLGSGILYGSTDVSAANNESVIEIALKNAAIGALDSATNLFVMGSSLSTINGTADQYAFGFRMFSFVAEHTRQLVLDIADIPEPPVLLLGVLAGAALFLRRLRRIQR